MTKAKKNPNSFNFEQSVDQLQKIIEKMEHGNLPLEHSLENFEQGIQLIRQCQQMLTAAQQKVEILTKDQNGEEKINPFEVDE
jgi:exodeoxyribonuclease VII small subunit